MAEEVKDRVKLETRQSFLEEKQRTLESNLEGLQGHRKEVVETRDRHLAEVDEKIQQLRGYDKGLSGSRRPLIRAQHLVGAFCKRAS